MILYNTAPSSSQPCPDDEHHACVELFTGMHLAGRDLLVPATAVAEVGYLLAREAGARVEALFLTAVAEGDFQPVDFTAADYHRMAELVEQYADFPLGTTDASAIALAERLDLHEIATLDRRHFTVVRPRHIDALTPCRSPQRQHNRQSDLRRLSAQWTSSWMSCWYEGLSPGLAGDV